MQRIQRLDPLVVNKIAAGEVVERPASVVKELVENAVDAGASEISVELEDGGCKRITVIDNGGGIAPDDCALVLERHATSKLRSADDLFAIASMGFRGEALAAISSVGRFALKSRQPQNADGLEVRHEDGRTQSLPWNGRAGTVIDVGDLFYNLPVRAKFLKARETEYAHCVDWVQSVALAHPHIHFRISHNGKERHSWSSVGEAPENGPFGEAILRQRWRQVFGDKEVDALLYCTNESEYGSWEALVSPPGVDKATSKQILNFVNERWVKDKALLFGVLRGYHSHLLKGRYPIVLSFLRCDPSLIDVNVHPAKTELRFQYSSEVQSMIAEAIRRCLRKAEWASPEDRPAVASNFTSPGTPMPAAPPPRFSLKSFSGPSGGSSTMHAPIERSPVAVPSRSWEEASHPTAEERKPEGIPWSELSYVGVFANCYLMFEHQKRLLMLDQHAFHERILYERLTLDPQMLQESQSLMIPEVAELAPDQLEALQGHQALFEKAGFRYRLVDARTVEIHGVPSLLTHKDVCSAFLRIVEQVANGEIDAASQMHHDILSTIACHSAVRAGDELEERQLQRLLREAASVDFYHNCPHGRRVFRWFREDQVAGFFDR